MTNLEIEFRQMAGFMLKSNMKKKMRDVPTTSVPMQHIIGLLLKAICDPARPVRSTAGTIISEMIHIQGLKGWESVVQQLVQFLQPPLPATNPLAEKTQNATDGAMSALYKICEDNPVELMEAKGDPLSYMIPRFIQFFGHPFEAVRYNALCCIIPFIPQMPNGLLVNMKPFFDGLFKLANDSSDTVLKYVCRTFVVLLEKPEHLKNYFAGVCKFMIVCSGHKDESVAMEATEFWYGLSFEDNCETLFDQIKPFLPQLLPILMKNMIFTEEESIVLEEESNMPDKETDIKPQFFTPKFRGNTNTKDAKDAPDVEDDEDVDEDIEDGPGGDDDGFEGEDDWNLRKCSASSLDIISNRCGSDILPVVLPIIQEKMRPEQPWESRESAILALGAIAEGCKSGIQKYLPKLIPYLIDNPLKDQKPLVRSITCWALSRYSRWVVDNHQNQEFFASYLKALLFLILDKNKKVQEAACSAFAIFEENAERYLTPYLFEILSTFNKALNLYQTKNLVILFDAIGTLAEVIGKEMDDPKFIALIMPPLMQKFSEVDIKSSTIFPLFECVTVMIASLGESFKPFAKPVYDKSFVCLKTAIQENILSKGYDSLERDLIVCIFDLIGTMIEELGQTAHSYMANAEFFKALFESLNLENANEVKQGGFGLIGDIAKTAPPQLITTIMTEFMPLILKNIVIDDHHDNSGVVNNAIWAVGEITMTIQKNLQPFVVGIMEKLTIIMNDSHLPASLLENTATCIGRIAIFFPDVVSTFAPKFLENWLVALKKVTNPKEAENAYSGLVAVVKKIPHAFLGYFQFLCFAICNYTNPTPLLKQEFTTILQGFKKAVPENNWRQYLDKFPPALLVSLKQNFGID